MTFYLKRTVVQRVDLRSSVRGHARSGLKTSEPCSVCHTKVSKTEDESSVYKRKRGTRSNGIYTIFLICLPVIDHLLFLETFSKHTPILVSLEYLWKTAGFSLGFRPNRSWDTLFFPNL